MGFGLFSTRVNPIAVDVGTDSIKMLQLEPKDDQMRLVAAAGAEIPESARAAPAARDEFAADAIRKMLAENAFKGRQVVTCLPAAQMAVQHLRVGKIAPDEMARALVFEAQGKIPFDPTRAVIRHVIAGEVYQDQETKTEVILMAASRESVDRHLALLAKSKLEVVGIHVEPTALIRCFSHLFRRKGDENLSTLYIDLGAGSTHVVIAHGLHLVFAKHVSIGGDTFTKKVADALKSNPAAARQLRIQISAKTQARRLPAGVVAIGDNAQPLGPANGNAAAVIDPQTVSRVMEALEEPLDTLGTELELCVRYYESIFPGKQIDRAIFVGGESRHVTLCQLLARRLALPATLGDPMARLVRDPKNACALDLRTPQPGWAIAVGLGLGVQND